MLQAAEARLAAQNKDTSGRFSANLASRGGHDGYRGGDSGGNCGEFHGNKYTNHRGNGGGGYQGKGGYQGNGGGRGGYQGKNGGRGCYNNNQLGHRPRYNGPPCHIFTKHGHPANKCFKRFNRAFVTPKAEVNAATTSSHDPNWYSLGTDLINTGHARGTKQTSFVPR
jgi:hypothetical protein